MWTSVVNLAAVTASGLLLLLSLSWYRSLTVFRRWTYGATFVAIFDQFGCFSRLNCMLWGAHTALLQDFLLLFAPGFLKLLGFQSGEVLRAAHPFDHAEVLWQLGYEANLVWWASPSGQATSWAFKRESVLILDILGATIAYYTTFLNKLVWRLIKHF